MYVNVTYQEDIGLQEGFLLLGFHFGLFWKPFYLEVTWTGSDVNRSKVVPGQKMSNTPPKNFQYAAKTGGNFKIKPLKTMTQTMTQTKTEVRNFL